MAYFSEAVRRASSGDDASPIREKSSVTRRSRRGRSTATVAEKPGESIVISETEQVLTYNIACLFCFVIASQSVGIK